MTRRVLVIGLDALDPGYLDDAIGRGLGRTLAALASGGSKVRLSSVADCFAGAVWPTIISSQGPGQHNVADHFRLAAGSYAIRSAFVDDGAVRGAHVGAWPPVKALCFDVPKLPLARRPGDVEVAGWGIHAGRGAADAWPAEARRWLRETKAPPLVDGDQESDRDDAVWQRQLAERLVGSLNRRASVAARLLARADWDLAWVVASETHAAGHRLWKTPPLLDKVFAAADDFVGALAGIADEDTAVVVVSGHGMQPGLTGRAHLLPWLLRWGGVTDDREPEATALFAVRQAIGAAARDRLRRTLPVAIRHRLRARLMAQAFGAAHWPHLDAFPLPSEDHGYVRLNLRGREPAGRLSTADAARLLDELEVDLRGWRCADSGAAIVADVHRPQQRFPGPFAAALPDLVATWSGQGPVEGRVHSPRCGLLTGRSALDHRQAEHAGRGVLISDVPGLHATGDLVDVAPTVLALLGRRAPTRLEGRALL